MANDKSYRLSWTLNQLYECAISDNSLLMTDMLNSAYFRKWPEYIQNAGKMLIDGFIKFLVFPDCQIDIPSR